jgi:hypothetical protein
MPVISSSTNEVHSITITGTKLDVLAAVEKVVSKPIAYPKVELSYNIFARGSRSLS